MPSRYDPLFEPISIRHVRLKNRIVVPPMRTNRDIVGDDGLAWYQNLAKGGAGLIIVEAVGVERFGSSIAAEELARLAEVVHEQDVPIVMQLFAASFGCGSASDLSIDEVQSNVRLFGHAATVCRQAGFDGVEPHGAHGFMLNQFFSPSENRRTDRYGGALQNRMRLGLDIVREVRQRTGPDFLIFYRHTPRQEAGYGMDESVVFAQRLVETGIDVMDISPASEKAPADLAAPFKRALSVPVIGVNGMDDPDCAVEALVQARCDLVGIGRGLIADAHWPNKVREGRLEEIVRCVKCNEKCYGNLDKGIPIACAQW